MVRERRKFLKKNLALSFIIPLLFLILLLFVKDIIPFGIYNITFYDSTGQYIPFLIEYQDKLLNFLSMEYTTNAGLGQDFWLIFSYYLASPSNLFLLFFNEENFLLGINLLTILRMAACTTTCTYYLQKKHNTKHFSVVVFSLIYTFNSYMMAYFCNIMWLDTICVFPLILLNLERMQKGENTAWAKYSLFLGYAIFSNYYLAIPICIFLIFYFLLLQEIEIPQILFHRIFQFAGASLLGAGYAASIILPNAYYYITNADIINTHKAGFDIFENWARLFLRNMAMQPLQTDVQFKPGGNLYANTFLFLLLFLYLWNKKIKKQERIKKILLIVFLFISMNVDVLNYIWHGLKEPNGYVNRFAFIFIFLLISMGYETFLQIRSIALHKVAISTAILYITIAISTLICNGTLEIEHITGIIVTMLLLLTYLIFIFLYHQRRISKKNYRKYTQTLIISEMVVYVLISFCGYGFLDTTHTYRYKEAYDTFSPVINESERVEFAEKSVSNDNLHEGLPGLSVFTSSLSRTYADTVDRLGFRAGTNFIYYEGSTELTRYLLNTKYIIDVYNYYSEFDAIEEHEMLYLYKNRNNTSYIYPVSDRMLSMNYGFSYNPLFTQNELAACITDGEVQGIYTPIADYKLRTYSETQDVGSFSVSLNQETYIREIDYEKNANEIYEINTEYITETYRDIAIYIESGDNPYSCNIKVNGEIKISDYEINDELVTVGDLYPGDIITVQIKQKDTSVGQVEVSMAEFNKGAFSKVVEYTQKDMPKDVVVKENTISFTTNTKEKQAYFLSIPYDNGWTVKKGNCELIDGKFLMVVAEPGKQEILLEYHTPWLNIGIQITICCFIILAGIVLLQYYKKINYKKI